MLGLTALPAHAEVTYPTGLRIGLEPPAEAILSTRFPGFEDADRKVTITVLDLPAAAFEQIEAAAFADIQAGCRTSSARAFLSKTASVS